METYTWENHLESEFGGAIDALINQEKDNKIRALIKKNWRKVLGIRGGKVLVALYQSYDDARADYDLVWISRRQLIFKRYSLIWSDLGPAKKRHARVAEKAALMVDQYVVNRKHGMVCFKENGQERWQNSMQAILDCLGLFHRVEA